MNYDVFFREVRAGGINFTMDSVRDVRPVLLSNEALFLLPFLAMTILLLASVKAKPKLDEIGQLVGECLERSFPGFKGSSQHLGWSANLRIRTVKALGFLELNELVYVDAATKRICIAKNGRLVIDFVRAQESDLSFNLKVIEREYGNINNERKIQMSLA